MDYRRFGDTYVLRMDPGEKILEQLRRFAEAEGIRLASVQGLGAVRDFTVGAFDTVTKEYRANRFQGAYEITSLLGTIDSMDGRFYCHLHMNAGDDSGHVVGGHLNQAVISATCELIIRTLPGELNRVHDPEIGLNLWQL